MRPAAVDPVDSDSSLPAWALAAGGPISPQQGGVGGSAPGGEVTYIAVGAGNRTVIESVRRAGGAVERFTSLRGSFGIPGVASDGSATGLSADGRTLVLSGGVGRYPILRTHLVVLDALHLRTRARIALPGWFNVDAISPTGRWLYLIHYPSASDTNRYEVRAYDLVERRLVAKPVIDPREPDEAMQGFPMTRAMSADGRWAYTLYDRGGGAPFIHALDTEGRTAACIDLPGLTGADLSGMRLVVGRRDAERGRAPRRGRAGRHAHARGASAAAVGAPARSRRGRRGTRARRPAVGAGGPRARGADGGRGGDLALRRAAPGACLAASVALKQHHRGRAGPHPGAAVAGYCPRARRTAAQSSCFWSHDDHEPGQLTRNALPCRPGGAGGAPTRPR